MCHVDFEVSFLKKMPKKLEGRVPILVCGGDVKIKGSKDCTGRYRVDLAGYPYSQHVHCRIVTSTIGDSITKFRSKKEFLNVMITLIRSKPHYAHSIFNIQYSMLIINMQPISPFMRTPTFCIATSVSAIS